MECNQSLIKKLAKNARINLSEKELKELEPELNAILENFKILDKAETKRIEPAFHPIEIQNTMRDDIIEKSLSQEQTLKNASLKKDGYFKGPKVV
ncbi:MAG: Asp-tRNA(Asn)/Glu-tRNA(Gln) amidotransferase subunit GatC [Nanoarchaeota archaeon]|nr:Asp-tRNA(Asn)/Glu-tRNA(Gln) amidotransferase subunit GatC [Nanoarchaeota archaeon]